MNNTIAEDLPSLMKEVGLHSVEKINSNEVYETSRVDFKFKVGIWSKVAGLTQMVDEGYITEEVRLQAIEEYDKYVEEDAVSMTMKLNSTVSIGTHFLRAKFCKLPVRKA